jgi:hypothetical protein
MAHHFSYIPNDNTEGEAVSVATPPTLAVRKEIFHAVRILAAAARWGSS